MANTVVKALLYYLNRDLARKEFYAPFCDATTGGRTEPLTPDLYDRVGELRRIFDTAEEAANFLFQEYNIGAHGGRRNIRSMSVGDLVFCVHYDGSMTGLLCAPNGWTAIDAAFCGKIEVAEAYQALRCH